MGPEREEGAGSPGPPGHGRPEEFGGVFSSVKWGIVDELNKETHGLIYIFLKSPSGCCVRMNL